MQRGPFDKMRWGLIPQGMFGPVQDGEPIADGVAATALVVSGNSGYSDLANWTGSYRLQVTVPGREPYLVEHTSWIIREKHPVPGVQLPVTVSRTDPNELRVEWDRAPTIDQLITANDPAIVDPERTWRRLEPLAHLFVGTDQARLESARNAMQSYLPANSVLLQDVDRMVGTGSSDPGTSPWQAAALPGWPPKDPGKRTAATALVVDVSHNPYPYMTGDSFMPGSHFASRGGTLECSPWHYLGRLLLCIVLPSGSRYGAYLRTRVHTKHMGPVLPVTVDPDDRADIDIEWKAAPDASIAEAARIDKATEHMAAVAKESLALQQSMWDAYTAPQRATAPRDIAAELSRLDQLHANGVLTDAELAEQRAKLLDSI
jgi:hypothetical protein